MAKLLCLVCVCVCVCARMCMWGEGGILEDYNIITTIILIVKLMDNTYYNHICYAYIAMVTKHYVQLFNHSNSVFVSGG